MILKLILPKANSQNKNGLNFALRLRVGQFALPGAAGMAGCFGPFYTLTEFCLSLMIVTLLGRLFSLKNALRFPVLPSPAHGSHLVVTIGLWVFAILLLPVFLTSPASAATGINQQINFQGRLLNSSGAVVPDGNYNIEFKIYSGGPGNVAGDTGGTLQWTEDWIYGTGSPDNRVVVRNGYFSINLGSLTSLSTVDFNSDTLWLSMNIGNITTAASFAAAAPDGEMLPMKRLTSTPYAFNSAKLGGLAASAFGQLSANNTFTGTNLFQPSASAAALQVSNATGAVLTVDTSGNNVVIGKAGSVTGTLQFGNATGANVVGVQASPSSAAYTLKLPTAAPALGQCLQNDNTTVGQLTWNSCGGGSTTLQQAYNASTSPELVLNATNGALTVRDASTSLGATTNLLEVQNNAGTVTYFGVTPSGINLQDANGATMSFDNTTNTLKVYENVASPTNFASISYSGGAAIFAASSGTTQIGSGSGNVSANLTGATDIYTFGTTLTAGAAYSQNNFSVQRTVAGGANALGGALLKVLDSSTANAGVTINPTLLLINQAATGGTVSGNLIDAQLAGTSKFSVTTAGNLTTAGSLTVAGLSNCTALQTSGAGLFSCASSSSFITALGAIDGSGSPNANGATVAAGTFYLNSASASFGGVVNTTTQTFAGNKTFNGLTSFNPTSSLVNGQSGISQTATFANATASGNVYGSQETLTVASTVAANNYGQKLSVNDTSSSIANTNTGLSVSLTGTNASRVEVGGNLSVSAGIGLNATSTGNSGSNVTCNNTSGNISVGVCASSISTGVYAKTTGSAVSAPSSFSAAGSGVFGLAQGSSAGGYYYGIQGSSYETGSGANSIGVAGVALAASGGTVYGGYFTIDTGNSTTAGSALYATTPAYSSTAGSGLNAVYVLQAAGGAGQSTTGTTGQVAGSGAAISLTAGNGGTAGAGSTNGNGGNITLSAGAAGGGAGTAGSAGSVVVKNQSNSPTAFQVQNASSQQILGVDTTVGRVLFGTVGAVGGQLVVNGSSTGSITINAQATAGTYTLTLANSGATGNQCLQSTTGSTSSATTLQWGSCGTGGGASSHSKVILLTPEYAGAMFDSANDATCSSANSGSMNPALDLTNRMNYYDWTSSSTTNQCFDIVVQVPVPSDWQSWAATPVSLQAKTDDTLNSALNIEIRDSTGAVETNFNYASTTLSTSWANVAPASALGGTYSAGGYMTVRIRTTAKNSKNLMIGNLQLSYTSAY